MKQRSGTCSDCSTPFVINHAGRLPERCRPCAAQRELLRGRAAALSRQRAKPKRTLIRWLDCSKCASCFPVPKGAGGGRRPRLCPACAETHSWCGRCQQVKIKSDFHKQRTSTTGVSKLCRSCDRASQDAWRKQNPSRYRDRQLRQQYGISLVEWAALLADQGAKCAICGRPDDPERRFHVDHCHTSGHVRGLLCGQCNTGLGQFGEDPAALRAAAEYVERHRLTT